MLALALVLAAAFPAHTPGQRPMAYAGPSGRIALPRWDYAPDPADTGLSAGWPGGAFAARAVTVPHVANPDSVGRPAAARSFRGSVGWYRTDVDVAGGRYALRFDSVAFRADVWVDGRALGHHEGAHTPFELRAGLAPGSHRIVVRADWRSPAAMSRAGWHRTWFNYGGVDREVTIRRIGASEVLGAAVATRLAVDGSARVTVTARVRNLGGPRRVAVVGQLRTGARTQRFLVAVARLGRGESRALRRTVTIRRPRLWSPDRPDLYDLSLTVPFESALRARVGLRDLRWKGGALALNGRRLVLRGASIHEDVPGHGDALTAADMDGVVHRLQAIGANATRAQDPLAPALLERLDRAGIVVWQGIGPVDSPGRWRAVTPARRALAEQRVREDLRAARLHPSIVAWSLGIEVAGNGGPGQGDFVDAMARELHAADAGRMIAVDVWGGHLPAVAGTLYRHLDAVGATSYLGWYEDTFASPAQIVRDLRTRLAAYGHAFPGKVLVLSEFGAEGTRANPPGQPGGEAYQERLLALHLRALRGVPGLDGALVWALRDFAINPAFRGGTITRADPQIRLVPGLNQKGLFDYAGRGKPAVGAVRAGFAGWR